MLSESVSFYIPERPYTPIDALNRQAAAKGSPGYAMATHYANYNGHHVTLRWNDYRGYYVAEYFWAGRMVIARGGFADCLRAVVNEYESGALGASAGVYPRKDDAEAIALCERTELLKAGDGWRRDISGKEVNRPEWYSWRHDAAAESVKDYCFPTTPSLIFDWELMQAAESREAYESALREKHGRVYR